eukprot:766498-Hanusia_phi.AAC.12
MAYITTPASSKIVIDNPPFGISPSASKKGILTTSKQYTPVAEYPYPPCTALNHGLRSPWRQVREMQLEAEKEGEKESKGRSSKRNRHGLHSLHCWYEEKIICFEN